MLQISNFYGFLMLMDFFEAGKNQGLSLELIQIN
jgi:hypothetical protein